MKKLSTFIVVQIVFIIICLLYPLVTLLSIFAPQDLQKHAKKTLDKINLFVWVRGIK